VQGAVAAAEAPPLVPAPAPAPPPPPPPPPPAPPPLPPDQGAAAHLQGMLPLLLAPLQGAMQ
jgi:hypothetical protein